VAERPSALPPDRGVGSCPSFLSWQTRRFDPEAVEVLSAAFEDAWTKLKQSGSAFTRPAYERGAREMLAKRIIDMAQRGERDRRQLSEAAVTYLTENYKG
jgi:hypothetical protein